MASLLAQPSQSSLSTMRLPILFGKTEAFDSLIRMLLMSHRNWDEERVAEWLRSINCSQYVNLFLSQYMLLLWPKPLLTIHRKQHHRRQSHGTRPVALKRTGSS